MRNASGVTLQEKISKSNVNKENVSKSKVEQSHCASKEALTCGTSNVE